MIIWFYPESAYAGSIFYFDFIYELHILTQL